MTCLTEIFYIFVKQVIFPFTMSGNLLQFTCTT